MSKFESHTRLNDPARLRPNLTYSVEALELEETRANFYFFRNLGKPTRLTVHTREG